MAIIGYKTGKVPMAIIIKLHNINFKMKTTHYILELSNTFTMKFILAIIGLIMCHNIIQATNVTVKIHITDNTTKSAHFIC